MFTFFYPQNDIITGFSATPLLILLLNNQITTCLNFYMHSFFQSDFDKWQVQDFKKSVSFQQITEDVNWQIVFRFTCENY